MTLPPQQKAPAGAASRCLAFVVVALLAVAVGCSPAPTPEPTAAPTGATPTPSAIAAPSPTTTPRPTTSPTPAPDLETVLADLVRIAAEVRGLQPMEEVSQVFLLDEEMRERVRQRLQEDLDDEKVETDRRILVMLDLIDPELDMKQLLVGLYGDAVVGYYDPRQKELVVRQSGESIGAFERVTFVHEFTHALQDQHFDIHGTRQELRELDNSDRHAAYLALIEGDAVLAESLYIFGHMTEDEQILMLFGGGGEGPDLSNVPEYIIRTLLFPYVEGYSFVHRLYREGGWEAVDRAYQQPPLSSSHILHPQRYLEGEEPVEVDLSALEDTLADSWDARRTDVMGEFVLYLHLNMFLAEDAAQSAAQGWRGDRYLYLVDDADDELLVLLTHWDSADEARQFFDAYTQFIGTKSAGLWNVLEASTLQRHWEKDNGREVFLERDGDTVLLVLSPRADATQAAVAALGR